ncbi:hypothetical protein AB0758_00045 [Tolypothrix bouteillei VB521301_2]|uniref:hypothetical protein n=1 Tax=Tolypothrix bouteillei TaxID=1246981 RepID=UPI0038B459D3
MQSYLTKIGPMAVNEAKDGFSQPLVSAIPRFSVKLSQKFPQKLLQLLEEKSP